MWAKKTQDISPFLISIAPNGERWVMVDYDKQMTTVPASYVLQESLLNKFVHRWFSISDDTMKNAAVWTTNCSRKSSECTNTDVDTCAIYCDSSDSVFNSFKNVVLPTYSKLESEYAEVWTVQHVNITPIDSIENIATNNGGLWKMTISVKSNQGILNFIGYARTSYNKNL